MLIGALDEATLYIVRAEDRDRAVGEVRAVLRRLIDALAVDAA